jgi:dipeptidase E
LLTSAGISNKSIHNALEGLLGKPVTYSSALFIPAAICALPTGKTEVTSEGNWKLFNPWCTNFSG